MYIAFRSKDLRAARDRRISRCAGHARFLFYIPVEVSLTVIAACLLGRVFRQDTIVVFDRIRENRQPESP